MAAFDALITALRACKPKPCMAALEQLRLAALSEQTKGEIEKISDLIDRYEFKQAERRVDSLRADAAAGGEQP